MELTLPPKHTLFHAKQALLDNVAKKMPALDVGYRRDARFFAGSEYLVETMLVAMLPDEVSVVFDRLRTDIRFEDIPGMKVRKPEDFFGVGCPFGSDDED